MSRFEPRDVHSILVEAKKNKPQQTKFSLASLALFLGILVGASEGCSNSTEPFVDEDNVPNSVTLSAIEGVEEVTEIGEKGGNGNTEPGDNGDVSSTNDRDEPGENGTEDGEPRELNEEGSSGRSSARGEDGDTPGDARNESSISEEGGEGSTAEEGEAENPTTEEEGGEEEPTEEESGEQAIPEGEGGADAPTDEGGGENPTTEEEGEESPTTEEEEESNQVGGTMDSGGEEPDAPLPCGDGVCDDGENCPQDCDPDCIDQDDVIESLFIDFTVIFGPYPTTCEEIVSFADDQNYQFYLGPIYECAGDLTAYGYPGLTVANFCCQSCPQNCGDKVCNFDESVANCYEDCGPGTLEEALIELGNFTILLEALEATELNLAGSYSQLTFFAPTDAAFEEVITTFFNASSLENWLSYDEDNVEFLALILEYHLLEGTFSLDELKGFDALETVAFPLDIQVVLKNTGVFLNGTSKIIEADIPATNGVIHVIDEVLLY